MKITIVLLFAALMQVSAAGLAQKLTLVKKDVTLKEVFKEINKQTGYNIFGADNQINNAPKIDANFKNTPLVEVLDKCLEHTSLTYTIEDKTVIIKEKEPTILEKIKAALNINTTIKGRVLDETGQPLVGATVKIKGQSQLTNTDIKGEFSLSITQANTVIQVSYIGYKTIEFTVNTKDEIQVVHLKKGNSKLDEVQVIAYGTTTQRLSTGSISKVTSEEIEQQPVSNPLAALEGKVPGLIITQSNGVPGSSFTVQIRGQNSIAQGSDPLFIIDGVPFASGNASINLLSSAASNANSLFKNQPGLSPFNSINPADIESIEVLKDADATAIYGSRGANGVILITTKKGNAGKTQVIVNVNNGMSRITHEMAFLNTQQYLQMRHDALNNDGVAATLANAPDLLIFDTTRYTNLEKMLIGGTAHTTDVQGSVSGGSENTQFIMSGNYHRETTVFPGDNADNRGAFHFSLNHASIDKKFTLAFSAIYSSDKNNILVTDLTSDLSLPPDVPAFYDPQGNLVFSKDGAAFDNPLSYQLDTYVAQTNNLSSNLLLAYQLLPGLTIKSSLGYNNIQINEISTSPAASQDPEYGPTKGYSSFGNNAFNSWIIEPQAEYIKKISKGKLDVLIGGSWQSNTNNNTTTYANGYSSDNLLQSLSNAGSITASNAYSQYHYEALFGRINYNWLSKYIIDITGRRDGSSRFGPGKQFANFGAAGGAWIFSNENFFTNMLPILSYGKLRGSYGVTGNDQIGDYQYLDSWSSIGGVINSYQGISALVPTRLSNPDYGWEINRKLEAAIELGFLKDRVLLTASYYRNRSSNQLVTYSLPEQTGFNGITANFPALVQNEGIELSTTSKNIDNSKFKWTTNINITFPKNTLLAFPGLANSSYASRLVVGQSLNVINRYALSRVNPQTGVYQFLDVNHDGTIDFRDNVVQGNTDPKFYGGLRNSFSYRNFQLDIFFEYRKQLGYNYLASLTFYPPGNDLNVPVDVLNNWQKPGDVSSLQKFTTTPGTPASLAQSELASSNAIFSDASYIRLKNLSLSYALPNTIMKNWNVASVRIYMEGQNLLTITGYKGSDPETQNLYGLPPLRTLVIGLQLKF